MEEQKTGEDGYFMNVEELYELWMLSLFVFLSILFIYLFFKGNNKKNEVMDYPLL